MSRLGDLSVILREGWCSAPSLCQRFNWNPNTLRGAVSQVNTKIANAGDCFRVERKREHGVTWYRLTAEAAE